MRKTCRKHLSPPGSGSGRRSWRVLDLAHEKTHEPHPTNTFQNTSHARKLNIFSFVPSIAPSVRKRDIYRNLKIFPIPSSCIFIFSFEMVNRMFRACLHAWAKAVRCDLWALFLPVALPLCIKRPSRKLQHFKSIPGKKNSAETRNSEELKKKKLRMFFSKTEKNAADAEAQASGEPQLRARMWKKYRWGQPDTTWCSMNESMRRSWCTWKTLV